MKHNEIEKKKENKGEYHLAYANTQPNAKGVSIINKQRKIF